ncbi:hypothetical protein DFH08DRAFT_812534 [Mycena albidolilacea]|uniref:Uncharacterized protein n=1 Tax=Mycena albidolilacea TaxID=1033008 RepID=A0AAD6ZTM5_9AGAR|nr:hypothetical protein DFH08DRAFT_812534 [Mycena albidolilacea]
MSGSIGSQVHRGFSVSNSVDPAAARESVKAAHYIHPSNRSGRGIQDDLCGGFICAYEHDWDDEDVRKRLHSSELSIGESFYIPLFYKDYKIDPDDLESGHFMSPVLLKGYMSNMTTSISSDTIEEDENVPPRSTPSHHRMETWSTTLIYAIADD